jgi:hypothetical protein
MAGASEPITRSIRVVALPQGGFRLSIAADAMLELMPVFETEGGYSNGPAWEALIEYLISNEPRLAGLGLDSESDVALGWSSTREPLDLLRSILLEAAADEQKLRKLIRDGRAAGFGHGDL